MSKSQKQTEGKKQAKPLTMKQEKFCREYLLTGSATQAYKNSYNTEKMKKESINNKGYQMLQKVDIRSRIDELRDKVEELTGVTKAKMIGTLQEVIERSLTRKPVMQFNPTTKQVEQKTDPETGEGVWEYDSSGVNSAVDKIMKAMGYYAPVKQEHTGKDGAPLEAPRVEVTVVKKYENTKKDEE